MRIGIVGLGYVGLVTAAVLSEQGNEILGVDIDKKKIDALNRGIVSIRELGLKELLEKKTSKKFSTEYSILKDADAIFISVPTPTKNGRIYTNHVMDAIKMANAASKNATIIIKSTVVPGTAKAVEDETGIIVVSNPEFVSEGNAVADTKKPDRIIIGSRSEKDSNLVQSIWAFTKAPMLVTSNENAELIKYASNSFLATKVSFVNELANLCEKIPNSDIEIVARGMGMDKRIGPHFLRAGIGFGGSCLPKDIEALSSFARSINEELSIIDAAIKVNNSRIDRVLWHAKGAYGKELDGANIGVLGLAFKKDTDDVRESNALKLIERMKGGVRQIYVYDPVVKTSIEGTIRSATAEECIADSDIIVIATDWDEFKEIKKVDAKKIIIDARRVLTSRPGRSFRAIGLDTHGS